MSNKTIAAIATPAGDGALGVIRISGDKAVEIADKIFFPFSKKSLCEFEGYKAAYGEVRDGDTVLDDAVALVFRNPHSFTGEDTSESPIKFTPLTTRPSFTSRQGIILLVIIPPPLSLL